MAKEKRPYYQIPLRGQEGPCPVCGRPLHKARLSLAFYTPFCDQQECLVQKVPFCNACHLPFLTSREVSEGLHLGTFPLTGRESAAYLVKRTGTPVPPVRNLPTRSFLFIGEPSSHACGPEPLQRFQYLLHGPGGSQGTVTAFQCRKCHRILLPLDRAKAYRKKFPDYFYLKDFVADAQIRPEGTQVFLLNVRQYQSDICPDCAARLLPKRYYWKQDGCLTQQKSVKECVSCKKVFARASSFEGKPYNRYLFSYQYYRKEDQKDGPVLVGAGDFLTRCHLQGCIRNGHDLTDILARIPLVSPEGERSFRDVPAVRCDTCGKLYILERDYQELKSHGAPLCTVVEEEYWRSPGTHGGKPGTGGSILYGHGYHVNAQEGLSAAQRQCILDALVGEGIVSRAQALSHLDMLIRRSEGQERLLAAHAKWEADRAYLESSAPLPMEAVEARSITHKARRRSE